MAGAVYVPVHQRLLPLDEKWRRKLAELPWPPGNFPEIMGGDTAALWARTRAGWRRCNAPKKIDELLEDLNGKFHRLRQSRIDEELFDVISGFEALSTEEK